MRRLVVLLALLSLTATAAAAPAPRVQGARSLPVCAGAGPYWPTQTLAVSGNVAWVACKEQGRVERVQLPSGKRRSVSLGFTQPIAVLTAFGAVWTLDSSGSVSRIDPKTLRVTARVDTGVSRPYNLWAGAGALWIADDGAGEIVRIDPVARRVRARIAVGDGPSDLVFAGTRAWVITHRDRGLYLLDAAANTARKLTTIPGDAPERIARAAGSIWLTGRGTDLLRLDEETGEVQATIEIGAGGIDVVAAAGSLWVPARAAAADGRGFPTMAVLRRVNPATGAVSSPAQARAKTDVHGLAPYRAGVLLADNTLGALYRVG
jgi:streptogramin lyase